MSRMVWGVVAVATLSLVVSSAHGQPLNNRGSNCLGTGSVTGCPDSDGYLGNLVQSELSFSRDSLGMPAVAFHVGGHEWASRKEGSPGFDEKKELKNKMRRIQKEQRRLMDSTDESLRVATLAEEKKRRNVHEILGHCLLWGGTALVVSSGYFFLRYRDARQDVKDGLDEYRAFLNPIDSAGFQQLRNSIGKAQSTARTNSIVGYVFAGVGAASVIWGLVELLTVSSRQLSKSVSFTPAIHGNAVSISLYGGF